MDVREVVRLFPAKTVEKAGEGRRLGISVLDHGLLTAYVWQELRRVMELESMIPDEGALLAAAHDVGKINPLFLRKLLDSLPAESAEGKYWTEVLRGFPTDLKEVPHPCVSRSTVAEDSTHAIGEVVEKHHGHEPADTENPAEYVAAGGRLWQEYRAEALARYKHELGIDSFPRPPRSKARRAMLDVWAGMVTLADWIASQVSEPLEQADFSGKASELVSRAGFEKIRVEEGLDFRTLFGFEPRAFQKEAGELYSGPGLYILEAPMGYGKTEAALWLAYRALTDGRTRGIYFAMPTQLTSTTLWSRFAHAVRIMTRSDIPVNLVHQAARLLGATMGKEAAPGGEWASTPRRALLGNFGVGTIDQCLLAGLPVRFHTVRWAGLVPKVVVFDEVHSYDAYTSTLLQSVVRTLRLLGCTVIILSATLTHQARKAFLDEEADSTDEERDRSPVRLTAVTEASSVTRVLPADRKLDVRLDLTDDQVGVEEEVIARVRRGERVLWIENTVGEAQRVFRRFSDVVPSGLLHGRFRPVERLSLEERWTAAFAPEAEERSQKGLLLVGTQVLEMSLDLDADYLVSRIAPMDHLLQRMGRLWRHERTVRPADCTAPRMTVLVPGPGEIARGEFDASGVIYAPYVLWKTCRALGGRERICFPDDISELLEAAYGEEVELPEPILRLREDVDEKRRLMSGSALVKMSISGGSDRAPCTRWIEGPEDELLILDREFPPESASGAELTLWCEERLVRTPFVLERDELPELPGNLRKFLTESSRFGRNRMAVGMVAPDGGIQGVRTVRGSLTYTKSEGLFAELAEGEVCMRQ